MTYVLIQHGGAIAAAKFAFLVVVLAVAVWNDVRSNRVPNALVALGLAGGLLFSVAIEPMLPMRGLTPSVLGALSGFACLMPFYLLRAMGAGDVKLMAMVGSFLDPLGAIGATLLTLLAGGLLALGLMLYHGVSVEALTNVLRVLRRAAYGIAEVRSGNIGGATFATRTAIRVPYAVAIAGGTLAFLALRWSLA